MLAWRVVKLGEVVEASKSMCIPNKNDERPYIALENVASGASRLLGRSIASTAASAKTQFRAGDVLYGKLRPNLDKVVLVPFDGVCSTDILALRSINKSIDHGFLLQLLHSPRFRSFSVGTSSGTKMPRTSWRLLSSFEFRLPSLAEQRKIAGILSSLDESVQKTEVVIQKLRAAQRALMETLLKRGLPGQHGKYLPLGAEWRLGRLEGVRQIPESWKLVRLTSVARLESGHTPSKRKPEYWNGEISWVSLHDSKHLDVHEIMETAQRVSSLGIDNSSARLLPRGTVVFSRTATVGKCTVLGRAMATSQDFANYVCGERLHNRYLMHLFRNMGREWDRLMAGSTHKTIYMPIFQELQILLPPREEQVAIANVGDLLESRLVTEERLLVKIRSVKATLLPALLSGEIRASSNEATP